MVRELTHFIGGKHTAGTSGLFADVYDPNTGAVQARVPLAGRADTEAAIADAETAQQEWGRWNPQRRARVLLRFLQLVEGERDSLARLLSSEHGKTVADAHGDLQRGLEVVEFAAGIPHLLKGEFTDNAGTGIDVHSLRSPLGVVAGITPFNFPAMIPLWKAAPALACGNAFILKPSERDPSVPLRLAELFLEAGLPPGVLNVVNGGKEAVDTLLEDPRVQALGFVGSTPIAAHIYATAAAHGKRAQCFGGAKNHMIVMPDADLDQAAEALIGAGYGSAGERCMAISVAVPVGEETADALVAKLKERIASLRIGTSDDPDADFGPLVSRDALDRVNRYIGIGVDEGAELVVDGRGFTLPGHENGFFAGASLFDRVTPAMRIYQEEIFGPVLCVARAADYEEALRLPSEHPFGNGVAIFTRDGDTARDFTRRVNTGMVGVNVPIPVPVAYHTFGGWKRSGFGDLNQHGPDSIRFYTRTKTVTSRWPSGVKEGASFTMPTMG
ncbi:MULTISPECIES: CoA-acylating methylmalonate-semialdehyde dehydrogenase [Streptomyces]|uniref:methylmalonate-semialdehyde dehydrogenase (CoA acylating) n=1 Tax=Streptomyces venezuelae (strain ATCC 10712 / CBS 650.69 / DSM 40230 / JCM 4526 / NBRC 13096 / PD 04745) TaxID=953739 RepID=F2R849_STRVP|nr:CoA-acylating methylmalonate-semialdehyde dehydrogenase [Streptomyces venezuelae]APE24422.1 methylmalonate-semialdehyde dehydrogenase (acylating) [Streptomyces venezuelae]QES01788.1 methylmalonate-semialdehyde dehydrogenase (CoA acylating) [Streptomyces venezuelae ATCC 10712]CCA58858.1 Methylmalonate-semialdehyde dehydrogenase [Streptomyces venezuelae ATCC 10712]